MKKINFDEIKEEKLVNIESLLKDISDNTRSDYEEMLEYDNPFAYLNDYDVDSIGSIRCAS